jgi:hypothetical protein
MAKLIIAFAVIAASGITAASSQPLSFDTRCTETDQALSQRLHDVLAHDPSRSPALNSIMARMSSARFDCKHGRVERGLQSYMNADAALHAIEKSNSLSAARSGTASAVH